MAKRRGRKAVKKAAPSSSQQNSDAEEVKEPEIEDKEAALLKQEGIIQNSQIFLFLVACISFSRFRSYVL